MKGAASERLLSARHSSQAISAVTIGTGARKPMSGHENQRAAMLGSDGRGPQADRDDGREHAGKRIASESACPFLQLTLHLQHQPSRAEKRVAEDEREAGDHRERREAVERVAGEMAPVDLESPG